MNVNERYKRALYTLPLVVVLWFVIFRWAPLNFWVMMGTSVGFLGILSLILQRSPILSEKPTVNDILLGVGSAVALYAFFWIGNALSRAILPFAGGQITNVYGLRSQLSPAVIALVLLFVIGPGEELFWHGFIQDSFMAKFGRNKGYWLTVAIYAGVHVISGNFMLVMAALVAGLFWGWMYLKTGRLTPALISHALWDVAVMALFPIK